MIARQSPALRPREEPPFGLDEPDSLALLSDLVHLAQHVRLVPQGDHFCGAGLCGIGYSMFDLRAHDAWQRS